MKHCYYFIHLVFGLASSFLNFLYRGVPLREMSYNRQNVFTTIMPNFKTPMAKKRGIYAIVLGQYSVLFADDNGKYE